MIGERSRTHQILGSIASLGGLSLIPKFIALAKDMAVASHFGASGVLDVYLMSFVLIGVPVSVIIVALQTTLIPALVNRDTQRAAIILSGTIKIGLVLLTLALPVWLILLPLAIEVLYPATSSHSHGELMNACLWLIPYYFCNGVNLLLYGALQARKTFWPNAILPGVFPIAILVAIGLSIDSNIQVLLMGTVAGSLLEGLGLLMVLRRERLLKYRHAAESTSMKVLRSSIPLMLGGVLTSLAPVIDQLIAFGLGPGAVSTLSFGSKVPSALNSMIITAVGIVVLPHFTELVLKQDWRSCKDLHLRLSGLAFGAGLLIATIGIVLSEQVIRLLFERGAFTSADTLNTASVMRAYMAQLPFVLIAMISMRALVAMNRIHLMTWITMLQVFLSASLALFLSTTFGTVGVALGTSLGIAMGSIAFTIAAQRQFYAFSKDRTS